MHDAPELTQWLLREHFGLNISVELIRVAIGIELSPTLIHDNLTSLADLPFALQWLLDNIYFPLIHLLLDHFHSSHLSDQFIDILNPLSSCFMKYSAQVSHQSEISSIGIG